MSSQKNCFLYNFLYIAQKMQIIFFSQLRCGFICAFHCNGQCCTYYYFNDGFSYLEIAELLKHVHDFQISLSTLKRCFKGNNPKRRPPFSNEEIWKTVLEELNGSGSRVVYCRGALCTLVRNNLVVRKHIFKILVKELAPKSPSFTWHIHGYDKSKCNSLASMGVLTTSLERYFCYSRCRYIQ